MRILMIQNNEIKPQLDLLLFLEKYGQVDEINFANLKLDNINEYNSYDLIVSSGSAYMELNSAEILYGAEMSIIKKISPPIIGICFGFELIAKSFGENIILLKEKMHGLQEIIFQEKKYTVWQNHFWGLQNLNHDSSLEILGTSNNGIEIIKVKNKNIFGLQFHPEHTQDKNDGEEIFEKILDVILSNFENASGSLN